MTANYSQFGVIEGKILRKNKKSTNAEWSFAI